MKINGISLFVVCILLAVAGIIAWSSHEARTKAQDTPYACLAIGDEVCPDENFVHALTVQRQLQDELREQERTDKGVQTYEAKQRELFGVNVQLEAAKQNAEKNQNMKWDEAKRKFIKVPPPPPAKPEEKKTK